MVCDVVLWRHVSIETVIITRESRCCCPAEERWSGRGQWSIDCGRRTYLRGEDGRNKHKAFRVPEYAASGGEEECVVVSRQSESVGSGMQERSRAVENLFAVDNEIGGR